MYLKTNYIYRHTFGLLLVAVFAMVEFAFSPTNTYAQNFPEGMISYWKFDEDSGAVAQDSLNVNIGNILDATRTTGIVGGALSFDGVNDYVQIADNASLDLQSNFTLEAWINPRSLSMGPGGGGGIISKVGGSGGNNGYQFALNNESRLDAHFNEQGQGWTGNSTTFAVNISINEWNHVVWTYNNNESKIYHNGVLIGTKTFGLKSVVNSSSSLRISSDDNENVFFDGLIDEVAIYNRALTPEEIHQHYQNGLVGIGYEIASFTGFNINKAHIDFKADSNNKDSYDIKGEFFLGQNSEGIDLIHDEVVVTVGSSTITIPAGSFSASGSEFVFEGTIQDVFIHMIVKETTTNVFHFTIEASNLDLANTSNPVTFKLRIGNNFGTTSIKLQGKLRL